MKDLESSDKIVIGIIVLSAIIALAATGWLFLVKKDYYFTVEESCDPQTETCFHRDCSIADECPPNNLSDYKVFKVHARDFPKCLYNSCKVKCTDGSIQCIQVKCGSSDEDSCSSTPEPAAE